MKNNLIYKLKNTINIKIKGKNIERFIKRLNSINIELLEIKYLKYNEIIIKIKKEDYERLEEVKTIYEIEIVSINGMDKLKQVIKKNKYLILSLLISIFILLFLCNTIFNIEVIHNDKEIRELLLTELKENGIEKYKRKKHLMNYNKSKRKF